MITFVDTMEYGFRENLMGTKMIRAAANMLAAAPEHREPSMKAAYVEVANQFGTTPVAVEKAMRYAVNNSTLSGCNSEIVRTLAAYDRERSR